MKTIIQILVAAAVVNACIQGAAAKWENMKFADAVEQEARFGNQKTTATLHRRVLEIGEEHGVPLAYGDVAVSRRGAQTTVEFAYTRMIPFVPRLYEPEWTYDVSISVHPVRPLTPDDLIK